MQEHLKDHRDRRGLKHDLSFVLSGVLIAILLGRKRISSIQRFISNRLEDLCHWTGYEAEKAISDPQLRRLLKGLDWQSYNRINAEYFNVSIEQLSAEEWTAVDGKELRGTLSKDERGDKAKRGEVLVNAIRHRDSQVVAQTYYRGDKESEKTVVGQFLKQTGLSKGSVSLDALHCNPKTTALIHQHGGRYITQVKANQLYLMEELQLSTTFLPCLHQFAEVEKAHGRIAIRKGDLFDIRGGDFEKRWQHSGLSTLVKVQRHFTGIKTGREQKQTSYYISNQPIAKKSTATAKELLQAIRGHWSVEADNYVRDVLFSEDHIPTPRGNATRALASIRSWAVQILRKTGAKNLTAKMEQLWDCPKTLEQTLNNIGFFT